MLKNTHLTTRFFATLGGLALLMCTGLVWPELYTISRFILLILVALVGVDFIMLYHPKMRVSARRATPKSLSLGDPMEIKLTIWNRSFLALNIEVYDELPFKLQVRDFKFEIDLEKEEKRTIAYPIRPTVRGDYEFGQINLHLRSPLGLVARQVRVGEPKILPCMPSIVQMKKFELMAFARISTFDGIKKYRRMGHSYEFDQIKTYVSGDDIRSINWKATSRHNQLMVNHYEDERAQQVYCIIDKSRVMRMPFEELSLLDHAINTSLVISNIALKKHDKAGLISFSDKIGSTVKAENSPVQLKKIMTSLYNEKEATLEANYALLHRAVKNIIKHRSLLFLFLNFESMYAMDRALPTLMRINRMHLLVVVFFENTELTDLQRAKKTHLSDIYTATLAQNMVWEKKQMVNKLKKNGVQAVLSRPEELSLNTVNKYLSLKSKGMI